MSLDISLVHHKRQRLERCNLCWRSVERHWSGSCREGRSQTGHKQVSCKHTHTHPSTLPRKQSYPKAHPSKSSPRSRLPPPPPIITGALFCSSTNVFFSHVLLNVGLCTRAWKSLLENGRGEEGVLGGGAGGAGDSVVWSASFTPTPWSRWVIVAMGLVQGTRMAEQMCAAGKEGSIGSVSRGSLVLALHCAEEP